MEIKEKVAKYLTLSKEQKNWPAKDGRFPLLIKNTKSKIFPAYCEFSQSEKLFQAEKPLAVFLYSQPRELIRSLLERFVQSHVLESNAYLTS